MSSRLIQHRPQNIKQHTQGPAVARENPSGGFVWLHILAWHYFYELEFLNVTLPERSHVKLMCADVIK